MTILAAVAAILIAAFVLYNLDWILPLILWLIVLAFGLSLVGFLIFFVAAIN